LEKSGIDLMASTAAPLTIPFFAALTYNVSVEAWKLAWLAKRQVFLEIN